MEKEKLLRILMNFLFRTGIYLTSKPILKLEENMKIAAPKVYMVGSTKFDKPLLIQYLEETGNQDFIQDIEESGVDEMDICSFYAKLCYKSLTITCLLFVMRVFPSKTFTTS